MASPSSLATVVAALAGNSFVTVIKVVAFLLSGSGAMLSEAVHSGADTGNQLLLFMGLRRGSREADERFHYGYGGERFVFGLLSAAGIFFIGCGVTLYHAVSSFIDPHQPELGVVTFLVLGVAFVIEGGVLVFAVRSISRQRGTTPFVRYVRESADPAAVAILLEDGAAVLGLLLAALGILAAYLTGNPMWDALGSLLVGIVLGVIAILLILENRELLLGRAVPPGVEDRFVAILRQRPAIREVRDVKTRQLTPEAFKFKAEIVLDAGHLASRLAAVFKDAGGGPSALEALAAGAVEAVAGEIVAIEKAVRAEIPQAVHIDLEVAPPAPAGTGQEPATA